MDQPSGSRDRSARQLALVTEIAVALGAAGSLDEVEAVALDLGRHLFEADGAVLTSATAGGDWRTADSGPPGADGPLRPGREPHASSHPGCRVARDGRRLLVPSRAGQGDADQEPPSSLDGRQSWVVLPLPAAGAPAGSLALSWRDGRELDPDLAGLLPGFTAQCAQALARVLALEAERAVAVAVASTHRQLIGAVQRSLSTAPTQDDLTRFEVRSASADRDAGIGGDWYDAFTTSEGVFSAVVGDVAGHDWDAAARMVQARNLLRGIGHAVDESPARVLERFDQALDDFGFDGLGTAVLAQLHPALSGGGGTGGGPRAQVLRWSSAGHPPPLLLHPDGRAELLRTPADLLLGVDPRTPRVTHSQELAPGSTVLLFTDGLIERGGVDLDDGLARLVAAVQDRAGLPLDALCDALLELAGDVEDDVCLLALRTG